VAKISCRGKIVAQNRERRSLWQSEYRANQEGRFRKISA
jgi:hypothetical protein